MRDDYMLNDHPDSHRQHHQRQQHYHSPPGPHPHHTSSAKPNNAFFNTSPSNMSPIHDDLRHNDPYLSRKQMLSPKSSQKPYHPSKHNGSSHSDRYEVFLISFVFVDKLLNLRIELNIIFKFFSACHHGVMRLKAAIIGVNLQRQLENL